MAEQTTLVCDNPGGVRPCRHEAHPWYLVPPYQDAALRVDLCDQHAKGLTEILRVARVAEDGPLKHEPPKRHRGVQVTELRPTARTRSLKV